MSLYTCQSCRHWLRGSRERIEGKGGVPIFGWVTTFELRYIRDAAGLLVEQKPPLVVKKVYGDCRRRAPIALGGDNGTGFPVSNEDDWCGEYSEATRG